jgi:hypothetical protein
MKEDGKPAELKVKRCEWCQAAEDVMEKGINIAGLMESQDKEALWIFWNKVHDHPIKVGKILYPTKPRGYATATVDIAHYACNLSIAIQCRLRGEIQAALVYEGICDNIYKILPQFARW